MGSAKQLILVASFLEGVYFHALSFVDSDILSGAAENAALHLLLVILFSAPVLLWLIVLGCAAMVLATDMLTEPFAKLRILHDLFGVISVPGAVAAEIRGSVYHRVAVNKQPIRSVIYPNSPHSGSEGLSGMWSIYGSFYHELRVPGK